MSKRAISLALILTHHGLYYRTTKVSWSVGIGQYILYNEDGYYYNYSVSNGFCL